MDPDRPVVVGRITRAHGVRGWVRIQSWTAPPENLLGYRPWLLREGDGWRALAVDEVDRQPKGLIARLGGVDDRDAADALAGREIAVPRHCLPAAEDDEYYWFDLIGLEVRTPDGRELGRIERLLETGANDVLVVRGEDRERLVPFIESVVREVDLEAGRLIADWDPDF
jgi:16S rRNA processing protein RimM